MQDAAAEHEQQAQSPRLPVPPEDYGRRERRQKRVESESVSQTKARPLASLPARLAKRFQIAWKKADTRPKPQRVMVFAAPFRTRSVAVSRFSPDTLVQLVFAAFLLALAYPTARGRSETSGDRRIRPAFVMVAGVGIGVLAGLVGIGGAALTVPLMILGFGLRFKVAATSLAMNFLTGVTGAAGYLVAGVVQLGSLPTLILGAMVEAWAGGAFRDRVPERAIRRGFAVFMVFTAVPIAFDAATGR